MVGPLNCPAVTVAAPEKVRFVETELQRRNLQFDFLDLGLDPALASQLSYLCMAKKWPSSFSDREIGHYKCYLLGSFGKNSVLAIPSDKIGNYFCVVVETTGLLSPIPAVPQALGGPKGLKMRRGMIVRDPNSNFELDIAREWKPGKSFDFTGPNGLHLKCSMGANEKPITLAGVKAELIDTMPYLLGGKWTEVELDGEHALHVDFDNPKSRNPAGCCVIAVSPRTRDTIVLAITAPGAKKSLVGPAMVVIIRGFQWNREK